MCVKFFLFVCIFIFSAIPLLAQDQNLLDLSYQSIAESEVKSDNNRIDSIGFETTTLKAMAPILVGQKIVMIQGVNETRKLVYDSNENSIYNPDNLYREGISLGLLLPLEESALMVRVGRTLESDKKDISDEDCTSSGQIIFISDKEAEQNWQTGIIKTTAFGDDRYIPIFGFKTTITEDIKINSLLPIFVNVNWEINSDFEFLFRTNISGGQYRLTEAEPVNSSTVRFSSLNTGLGARYRITGPLWLTGHFGIVTHRRWEFKDKNGDRIKNNSGEEADDIQLEDSRFWQVGLVLRFD